MDLNYEQLTKWFLPNIKKIVRKTVSEMLPFTVYKGKVSAVSTDYASVVLQGDSVTLTNIINKTAETLSIGDRVMVWAINNDLGNAIIAKRMENDIA